MKSEKVNILQKKMTQCTECKTTLNSGAHVCHACGERVEGTQCQACLSYNKEGARLCKYCRTTLQTHAQKNVDIEEFEVRARLAPTILLGGTFLPQSCVMNAEKVIVTTPQAFGLAMRREEVVWNKVTGFQHHSGIIWDSITIETRGQSTNQIKFLAKDDARKIVEILQALQS